MDIELFTPRTDLRMTFNSFWNGLTSMMSEGHQVSTRE